MSTDRLDWCDVCGGVGLYPIYNMIAEHLYSIPCPHCGGYGMRAIEIMGSGKARPLCVQPPSRPRVEDTRRQR